MSAPLYSRYCRYFDRDIKNLDNPKLGSHLHKWQKSDTVVYSFSDAASREMGAFSLSTPDVLVQAMQDFRAAHDRMWIEFDWPSAMSGMGEVENQRVFDPKLIGDQNPTRVGFLMAAGDDEHNETLVVLYYVFPSGKNTFGGVIVGLARNVTEEMGYSEAHAEYVTRHGLDIRDIALGPGYYLMHKSPKYDDAKEWLRSHSDIRVVGWARKSERYSTETLMESNGTGRLVIAAMGAIMAAKQAKYTPATDPEVKMISVRGKSRPVIEINLFLKSANKPGHSIRKSLEAITRKKAMLHVVSGHWCYQTKGRANDPHDCKPGLLHLFEPLEGTKSEECLNCGQKRWFRDTFERGDETQGRAPRKTHNIRMASE